MKIGHKPVMLAAAAALLAMPLASGPAAFVGTAQAQGASGGAGAAGGAGGAGGAAGAGAAGGVGTTGAHGTTGSAVSEVAKSKASDTLGTQHALDVVTETPAADNPEAVAALEGAIENQTDATTTTTTTSTTSSGTTGGSVSFGQAMSNMAQDARDALSAVFGGSSEAPE